MEHSVGSHLVFGFSKTDSLFFSSIVLIFPLKIDLFIFILCICMFYSHAYMRVPGVPGEQKRVQDPLEQL